MGLIELASGNSVWRGLDYYERKKIVSWEKTERIHIPGKSPEVMERFMMF